jgi:peptide/nickel transport system substrate-binding protein
MVKGRRILMKRWFPFLLTLSLIVVLWGAGLPVAFAANKPIEFRWVSLMAIPNLDPTQMHSIPTYVVAQNLYDTLVFPDVEKGYIPWIAESWKVSGDGKKYTFFLKKGIPFHDGTEITADDVVFSMDRLVTMRESTMAPFFKVIKAGTTKVLDRYSLEFNLTERSPEFVVFLFMFKILNKKEILRNKAPGAYGEFGDYGLEYLRTHDAGSGPFTAVEHRVGNSLRMKRFDAYPFEPWKPNSVHAVLVTTIPEAVTEVTKLKVGELDMGEWTLPATSLKEFQKNENFFVSEELTDGLWTCAMNNTKPPLDDPYVRKAMAHAWNTELITRTILSGGKPARGPLPDSLRGECTDIPYYP